MAAVRSFCFLAASLALAGAALTARAQATSSSTSRADRATAAPPSTSDAMPGAPRIVMFCGTGIVVYSGPADVGDSTEAGSGNAAPRADEGPPKRAGAEVGPGSQVTGTESDAKPVAAEPVKR